MRGGTNAGAGSLFLPKSAYLGSNEYPPLGVSFSMKTRLLSTLLSIALAALSPAQTCREVARDASGRMTQTIDRQKQAGGAERAVIRHAPGQIIGSATT